MGKQIPNYILRKVNKVRDLSGSMSHMYRLVKFYFSFFEEIAYPVVNVDCCRIAALITGSITSWLGRERLTYTDIDMLYVGVETSKYIGTLALMYESLLSYTSAAR